MQANWLLVFLILILILSLAMNGSKAAAEVNSSLAVGANLQRDHETKQVGEPQSKLSQLEDSPRQAKEAVPEKFYVWLKSAPDRNALQNEIPAITERYKSVLGDFQPTMQVADLGQRGCTYRIVAGPLNTRQDAKELCMKIKDIGGDKACFVILPCSTTDCNLITDCNLAIGNFPNLAQRPWEYPKWIFEKWGQPKSAH